MDDVVERMRRDYLLVDDACVEVQALIVELRVVFEELRLALVEAVEEARRG